MKKYALLAAVIFIATSAGIAAAHWGGGMGLNNIDGECPFPEKREEMIARKAETLGLDSEQVLSKMEEGKTLKEIIDESGITREEIQEAHKSQMVEHLNQLVADGKITREQADEKLEWLENREGKGFPGKMRGHFLK